MFATLGHKAYSKWLFQRMLTCAIAVAGLMVIIAILLSLLLIGLLFAGYMALLHAGIAPFVALIIITIVTLILIGLLGLAAWHFACQLPRMLAPQSAITRRVSSVFNAFMDGFMEK